MAYSKGGLNCLIVMDEAHRFIATDSFDERIQQLSAKIIDSVRTTRQYGIGYMFITQTLESLHEEIRRQMRISAFGYGLTSGNEFNKIRDIVNDDAAAKFYRSFIDPTSSGKFPFMFYGPISPLSFTGSPLFLEMDGEVTEFDGD
jgi:DNA helicase HerA-like ATPase